MLRQKYLKKLKREATGWGNTTRLAKRLDMPIVTLWRIVNDRYGGNAKTWDRIFTYYDKAR